MSGTNSRAIFDHYILSIKKPAIEAGFLFKTCAELHHTAHTAHAAHAAHITTTRHHWLFLLR